MKQFIVILCLLIPYISFAQPDKKGGEYYQVTVYRFSSLEQQQTIDQYLRDAYLPALHKQQIKSVGVFTPLSNDTATDKRLYVIIPLRTLQQVLEIKNKLASDKDYQDKGKVYIEAAYKTPPYSRMENILLQAFSMAPFLNIPALSGPHKERIYELRSYESATEKIHQNKVHMFNEGGEVTLFKKLNFNAVFYGSVIAGAKMPNLMYMTSFENMADRDTHWKSFGAAPEWKKLSALPEYQNNVSKNETIFLHATDYSDY